MNNLRVYERNELQYKKLEVFSDMVNNYLEKGYVSVETTYFDYGQNWMYSALITHKDGDRWQSVCPRDYELIIYTDSFAILEKIAIYYASKINEGKINIKLYEKF